MPSQDKEATGTAPMAPGTSPRDPPAAESPYWLPSQAQVPSPGQLGSAQRAGALPKAQDVVLAASTGRVPGDLFSVASLTKQSNALAGLLPSSKVCVHGPLACQHAAAVLLSSTPALPVHSLGTHLCGHICRQLAA